MGGQRIDFNKVRQTVAAQPRTFTYTDIARECGISTASANKIVHDMLSEGAIIVDHKVGKTKQYAVSGTGGKDGIIKPNVCMLSPAKRFEYVGTVVDMIAMGISPSVLITGLSGIGKTYIVKKRLEANGLREDEDYIMVKGHASPMGLYRLLYEHQRQRLVFDDCDSIFKDADSINLLKAALDSYDVRTVSWHSSRMPDDLESSFEFSGQIIFVSNMTADRIDEPVKSRTMTIDLQMSRKEICEYIGTILPDIRISTDDGSYVMDTPTKGIVLDELQKMADGFEQFNIRTFIKACRIFIAAEKNGNDWKEMLSIIV